MALTDLSTIRDLCARYDFSLSKGFGQNFIINPGVCPRIAEAAGKGLDPKTKELIIIAVSAVNGCEYCLDAHRSAALAAGVTDEEITAAIEVAASISLYNNFNKAISLKSDLKSK